MGFPPQKIAEVSLPSGLLDSAFSGGVGYSSRLETTAETTCSEGSVCQSRADSGRSSFEKSCSPGEPFPGTLAATCRQHPD